MTQKRKPIKARPKKAVPKIVNEVWVQPRGLGRWKIEVNGDVLGSCRAKDDAECIGRFLARLLGDVGPTEFYLAKRNGEIQDRSTYPRSADPHPPRG